MFPIFKTPTQGRDVGPVDQQTISCKKLKIEIWVTAGQQTVSCIFCKETHFVTANTFSWLSPCPSFIVLSKKKASKAALPHKIEGDLCVKNNAKIFEESENKIVG